MYDPNTNKMQWFQIQGNIIDNGTVQKFMGTLHNINDFKQKESLLEQKVQIDPLTKAYNRDAAITLIDDYLQNIQPKNTLISFVCVVDLDNFKKINDTYGHQTGDKVLKTTADMIKTHIPDGVCGRFGGDEFIVLSEANDKGSPSELFEHMLGCSCCEIGGSRCEVNLSIGLCVSDKRTSYDDFFREADKALYTAKKSGKNRVVMSHI